VNVAADLPSQFPSLSQEAAIARRPEVLITSAPEWSKDLAGRPAWRSVPAVKSRRFFSPPPDITERPGPRLADAVLMLARFLHPEASRP
jgi:iron complex transport system substrate-binding protein